MNKTAIFPGSFSPFTIGHQSVIKKSLPLFDKIIIAIGTNTQKEKYFSVKQRKEWIKLVYKNNPKIKIVSYNCLTINYCKKIGAEHFTPVL